MLNEKAFECMLKSRYSTKDLYANAEKYGFTSEDLYKLLQEASLEEYKEREQLFWELQHMFERLVLENREEQNGDLADLMVAAWNAQKKPVITKGMVKLFIESVLLGLDHRKRAFVSLCDEDVDSCHIWIRKDVEPFVEWLIRLGLFIGQRELDIIDIGKKVIPFYYPNADAKDVLFETFKRLIFTAHSGKPTKFNFSNMRNYTQWFSTADLPFAKGLARMILRVTEQETAAPFQHFNKALQALLAEEANEPKQEQKDETPQQIEEETQIETANVEAEVSLEPAAADNRSLQHILDTIERLKEDITAYAPEQEAPAQAPHEELELLRKENARLKRQLEELENKQKEVSYEQLSSFIRMLAGKEGDFALHKLYEESNGSLETDALDSQGRLITLFSTLELQGVIPYTGGYSIGDTVTLKKDEIGHKFTVADSIHSDGDAVMVQITGYGWMLNGKVIVQPIVKQVVQVQK